MKTRAILEETRLIKQANDKLPPDERSESRLRLLYRTAAQEVNHDRITNPEKYEYMSDDDMSELTKQKFEEKTAEISGEPDVSDKEPDIEKAEDEYADEMGQFMDEDEEEFNIPGMDELDEPESTGDESIDPSGGVSDEELEDILGPLDDEVSGDVDVDVEDEVPAEGDESASDEESDDSPAADINAE